MERYEFQQGRKHVNWEIFSGNKRRQNGQRYIRPAGDTGS